MKESISALVDGEASDVERQRALRALHEDAELRSRWERYHLAGTVLRRELDMMVRPDLADRIRERLAHEVPGGAERRRLPLSSRFFRIGAGAAIAATVATVAILNLPPVLIPASQVARSTPAATPPSRTAMADARPGPSEQQRALNPYLVHHGEFTPAAGMNGMSSYVRVIGRDNTTDTAGTE